MPEVPAHPPVWECIGIVACILLSGIFSGTETVLTSLTVSKIHDLMADPARWGTRRLQRWLHHNTRILTSLLVGNNVVNIAASILGAKVAYHYLRSYAEAAAIGVMTLLILVFGEVVPKVAGKLWFASLAPYAILFASAVDRLLFVLAWPLDRLARAAAAKVGSAAEAAGGPSAVTEGEIQHMIRIGEKEGVIDRNRGELMLSVLEFKNTIAKEIMVPQGRIVAVSVEASIEKALDVAVSSGHSRIPVYREKPDNIEGLLYVKDLLAAGRACAGAATPLKDLVRRPPFFVPETKKISELLAEMQKKRVHLSVVVDEFGSTSGLITLEDIIEEIVGEIRDEYDKEEAPLKKVDETTFEAAAWISIYDLGESIGAAIPDTGEYETLGGFLTNMRGSVPPPGTVLPWEGLRFTVTESDPRRVIRVRIEKAPPGGAGAPPDKPPTEG